AIHGTKITIKNVPSASKQADLKFVDVMRKMGCKVSKTASGISLRGPKKLKCLSTIDLNKLPDAAMTVAIVAALAEGKTKITNIYNLRVKESDRIDALKNELTKLNIPADDTKDSLTINPSPKFEIHGNTIKTYNDHRVAMCFAVLGSKIEGLKIHDPVCVQKTYPTFWKDLQNWGIRTKKVRHIQNPNIYLIGMRGCGKTTDGKLLAKNLKYKFIDMDDFIEKKEGLKIEQIVKTKGWPHFRKLESEACLELSKKQKLVIGTGGGAILKARNLNTLKKNGYLIFLNAPLELLIKRIENDPNRPPLTDHKSLQKEMRHLWNERKHIYFKNADAVVDATDPIAVAEKLASAANLFLSEKS
ncbi:hypothetical protein GF340_04760, partial [Candidatus Peregrinibacteria bacterium]|nr:hypothetical protein [Candidatus Peregrinibacteria bacterium]